MLRFVVSLLVVLVAGAAHAERRVALVMGIDGYRSVRKLQNAVDDARSVEAALEQLGFEVTLETDRDLRRMRRALDDFREDGEGADVALVFFAGHGVEIAGDNRLLPADADASSMDSLKSTSLALEEVRETVVAVAKIGLVVLDACRNDPFGQLASQGSGRGVVSIAPGADVKPGLGRVGRAEGILFAFSAAPGETASDGEDGHSPFALALVKYLGTDGLEVRSALTLVQQEVYDRTRGRQLPYVENGLPALFFAAKSSDDLPERERLLLAMADVTPDLRAEVEQIAAANDMPLAPLYGALLGADIAGLGAAERTAKLTEAAAAFVKVRDDMRALGSEDPEVARLRGAAEEQLALGAFDAARGKLDEAAAIDGASRQKLKANYVERTLSEAATRVISGGAARADLRYDLAIDDLEKAVALYGEAGDSLPPEHADRRLATLAELGDLYTKVGDLSAAQRAYANLLDLANRRAAEDPTGPSIRRDVAIVHTKLGGAQVAQGDLSAALDNFIEARSILDKVIAESDRREWLINLAITNDRIGEVLFTQGDLDGAVVAFKASLDIKQELAANAPGDPQRQRDLTVVYDEIGDVLAVMGERTEARTAYDESLRIRLDLAGKDPEDIDRQRDVSVSHDKVGDLLRDAGELDQALESYRDALSIVEKLAVRDPRDTQLQRDRAVGSNKIGNVLRDQNDLEGAETYYREGLGIVIALAGADPSNTDWQRDMSVALEKVADVRRRKGDFAGALEGYEQSLPIMRRLVASDPTNANWRRDLSITLGEIGNLDREAGDRPGADAALRESLDLREALAQSEPDNAQWQRDLVIAYVDYAYVAKDPRAPLKKALAVVTELERSGRLAEKDAYMGDALRKMLAKLGKK